MSKKEVSRKKGQVTLFIILAIILVVAIGMFAYFRNSVKKEVEVVTTEGSPVITFVESCITNIAEDGIKTLGLNGGYISFPPQKARNPRSYLSGSPIKELMNPYWWHDGVEAIPTELFLKNQIEDHVTRELKACLNNFEAVPSYEIRELKDVNTHVEFTVNSVIVKVDYPLLVKKQEESMRIEQFSITVPVRLKKTYEIAKAIMENENQNMFLEKKTIDLISMDEDIPVSDIKLACGRKQWLLQNIKDKITRLLRVNLPYIKIKGTDYNPGAYVPTPTGAHTYNDSYYNYHYIWDIGVEDLTGMRVSFTYDDKWPLIVHARPSRNGVLSSNAEQGHDMLSFFCMQIWHFTYDIVYPVMATVVDEKTRDNDRFMFRFPFKVSVSHNQPYRQNFGYTLLEGSEKAESDEYCGDTRNEVTIYTSDRATQEHIAEVNLTFVCGRSRCDIGQTEWVGYGAGAVLTKELPYCTQALLIGNKKGYAESKTFIQTDLQGKAYTLEMIPIREFDDYFITKHPQSQPTLEEFFAEGEKAIITISVPEKNFESFGVYPTTQKVPLKFLAKEENTYKVGIYVTKGENIVGGYIGNWTISKDDIEFADRIKFHTVGTDAKTDQEMALFIGSLEALSQSVPKPTLS